MLEFLTRGKEDAINVLKQDHDKVEGLFNDFKKAERLSQKKKIAAEAIMELKIHAAVEEELFYPSLRGEEKVDQDLLNESDEEHHVAKLLIAELEQMNGSEDHYDAKFTVLAENIRHHVKEEEGKLFPQARKTEVDFDALGRQLLARKKQLKKDGVPPCAEEKMIAAHKKGSGDSPARAAKTKSSKSAAKSGVVTKAKGKGKPAGRSKSASPKSARK
jgi:hemerythrin superfamily protein